MTPFLSSRGQPEAPTVADMTPTAIAAAALERLASELIARGWIARMGTARGRPSLRVQNPDPGAARLAEHILVGRGLGGIWTYMWPWADPIAPVAAVGEAAARITHVLRTADPKDMSDHDGSGA